MSLWTGINQQHAAKHDQRYVHIIKYEQNKRQNIPAFVDKLPELPFSNTFKNVLGFSVASRWRQTLP